MACQLSPQTVKPPHGPVKGGARVLIAAGRALDDAGVDLEDLGIRRPSLDDVFLAITGHPADAGQAAHAPGAVQ